MNYIDTYREWNRIRVQIKKFKHKVTPERFQELKKQEGELLAKLNSML